MIYQRIFASIIFCGVGAGLTACLSLSDAQTARTLAPGKVNGTAGLSLIREFSQDDDKSTTSGLKSTSHNRQDAIGYTVSTRYGLAPALDLGARITSPGYSQIDGKYQLVNGPAYALAASLGFGYGAFYAEQIEQSDLASAPSRRSRQAYTARYTDVSIHNSVDVSKRLALYASPRYTYVDTKQSGSGFATADSLTSSRIISAAFGAITTAGLGFFAEAVVAESPDKKAHLMHTQVNVGLAFNEKKRAGKDAESASE